MKRMKRLTALVLTLCMLFTLAPVASAANGTIKMTLNSNTMTVNGVSKKIDDNAAIKPQVKTVNGKGYTMLPLRAIVEAMGGQVYYDTATKVITMTYNGTTVKHTIGTKTATVNGVSKAMEIASYAANDRTYVHLRAIELLSSSISVNWVATAPNDVTITYPQVSSSAAKTVSLTIKNATATSYLVFESLKLAPAGSTNFSGNLLGETLINGGSRTLTMAIQPGKYDLQGVDQNKNVFNWYNLDFTGVKSTAVLSLTSGAQYVLSLDGTLTGTQTAQVTVVNDTKQMITKIDAYHSTSTLANAITVSNVSIGINGYTTFTIPYEANAPYYFLVVTLANGSTITYQYVNLGTPYVTVYLNADGSHNYNNAGDDTGVYFVNRTGSKISTLQMKVGEGNWTNNLLKKDLKAGEYVEIDAYTTTELRNMDVSFRIKTSGNGKSVEVAKAQKESIVFYYGSDLSVKYDIDPADITYEEGLFLYNKTGIDFDFLYVINANEIYDDYEEAVEEYYEDEDLEEKSVAEYLDEVKGWKVDDFFDTKKIAGEDYDWEDYEEHLKKFDDRDEELIDEWYAEDLGKADLYFMGWVDADEDDEFDSSELTYGSASISKKSSAIDYNVYITLDLNSSGDIVADDIDYDYSEDEEEAEEGLIVYNNASKAKVYVADEELTAENYKTKYDEVFSVDEDEYEVSKKFDDYSKDIMNKKLYFYVDFTSSSKTDYASSFTGKNSNKDNVCLIIGSKASKCDQEYDWIYEEDEEDETETGVYMFNDSDYKITEILVGTTSKKSEAEVVFEDSTIKAGKTKEIDVDLEAVSEETLYFWVEYYDSEAEDDDTLKDDVTIGEYEVKYEDNLVFRFTGTKVSVKYDQDMSDYGI